MLSVAFLFPSPFGDVTGILELSVSEEEDSESNNPEEQNIHYCNINVSHFNCKDVNISCVYKCIC